VVEEGPEDEAVLVGGGPGRGRASLGAHRSSRRSFPAAAAGGAGRRWSGAAGSCPWPDSPGISGLLGAAAVGELELDRTERVLSVLRNLLGFAGD
jgi:hypothetical protein